MLAIALVAVATRWGGGVSVDSLGYTSIARNLLDGQGYRTAYRTSVPAWPPLYSLILAGGTAFGPDPATVARWLNALLCGANVLLVGLMLRTAVRAKWLAVLGAFAMAVMPDSLRVHSMIWTEPLFVLLVMLALWLLSRYARRPARSCLVAAGVASALAVLTRYAGLSLIAAGTVFVLAAADRRARRRLADAVLFAGVACVPLAGWMLRNALVAGSAAGRTIGYHPPTAGQVRGAVETLSRWLLPQWVPLSARVAALAIVVLGIMSVAVIAAARAHTSAAPSPRPRPGLCALLATFVVLYAAQLLATVWFVDRYMSLGVRQWMPAFPAALVIVLVLTDTLLSAPRPLHRAGVALAVLTSLLAFWYANRAFWWVSWAREHGLGYRYDRWRESPTIELVRQLDDDVPVFTNAVHVLHLYTGRLTTEVPSRYFYRSGKPNEHIDKQLEQIAEQMAGADGVIVYFDRGKGGSHVTREELEAAIQLRVRYETADGVILELDQ